jgi:hypothetical protein
MSVINEVFTAAEAALLWGLSETTVKKSCQQGRLILGAEARKSPPKDRGVWLVTRAGMERLYGPRKDG